MPNWVQACPNCRRKWKAIGGDGPQPCSILCIGERPGRDENLQGRVFCGKTGQEWDDLYLPLAGLDRSQVRVCNAVLCWAESNKKPSDKEILQCASHHLPQEIERTNPEVIILMGSTACRLCPGIKLEMMHGIPQPTSKVGDVCGWKGWVIPMYHPAIGLHESRWMQILMEDWTGLKSTLDLGGIGGFDADPPPPPTDYRLFKGYGVAPFGPYIPGVDTESHGGVPWSVQVSNTPGLGCMYLCSDKAAMGFLRSAMTTVPEIVLHNAAYDLEVLRRLQIPVRGYRDTMQEAFHLGNLPQGLKALAYRLFRHTMTSYQETVRPASIHALQEWTLEAVKVAEQDLCYTERKQLKTRVKEISTPGPLEPLLRRLLRLTDVDSEYDPWERLDAFWADGTNDWMTSHIEARVGKYPILGIANCKIEDAVRYACGDADWTGQAAVELARRRKDAFKIYRGDRDA